MQKIIYRTIFKTIFWGLNTSEFRTLCEQYAREQVEIQKVGFKRLGVLADYENPYITLDPAYEAEQIRAQEKEFNNILFLFGNYALRRAVAEIPSSSLRRFYAGLYDRVFEKNKSNLEKYLEHLNCTCEDELANYLWLNYDITIKII